MVEFCRLICYALVGFFRPRVSLEVEILMLRHQLNVLRRKSPKRSTFSKFDRLIFAGLYGLAPNVLSALAIVRPETVVGWHRAGFRLYWRWKSRSPGGRPRLSVDIRKLIRDISFANPLWGTPRIHGELLKLGIDFGQTTVAKYMARNRRPPSQGWKTFLRNHADGIASMDLFVVDHLIQAVVWASNFKARLARNPVPFGNCTSHGGMDKSPTYGGFWLGGGAQLPDTRSGSRLRRSLYPASSGDGHSG